MRNSDDERAEDPATSEQAAAGRAEHTATGGRTLANPRRVRRT